MMDVYENEIQSIYKIEADTLLVLSQQNDTLNIIPNNRVLVRLTVDDIEATTNIMDDLFLKDRRGVRKQMLVDMDVSIDDIDN